MRKYATVVKKYPNQSFDRIVAPPADGSGGARLDALDADGICRVGEAVDNGQVYVNKQSPVNTNTTLADVTAVSEAGYKPAPLVYRAPAPGYVDKVLLTSNADNQTLVRVLMRSTRRPEVGDKFSR
jgi:DNA-directed RNA polymerase III subunit RPC2